MSPSMEVSHNHWPTTCGQVDSSTLGRVSCMLSAHRRPVRTRLRSKQHLWNLDSRVSLVQHPVC